MVARRSTNGRSCGCAAGMRVIVIAPTTVTVIQRMLIQPVAYLWEIVSSIKRNCFKTSDLLNKTTFGRAPKFFLTFTSEGDGLLFMYSLSSIQWYPWLKK